MSVPIKITEQKRMKSSAGFELHWHQAIEFYFVLQGGVEVLCNGAKKWLYKGDSAFIGWCNIHKGLSFLDDTVFLTLFVDLSSITYMDEIEKFNSVPTFIDQDLKLIELASSLLKESKDRDSATDFMTKSYIYSILGRILRLSNRDKSKTTQKFPESLNMVKNIMLYIYKNSSEQISLEDLSKEIGVTKNHICREFKKLTGQTVNQYINETRCFKALSYINKGTSFSEAAYLSGFNDYNYFSRVFKRVLGKSPRNYISL